MLNVQEAVSEEVMLIMPVSPPGMFCFAQLCTRETETHSLWMSAQDMTSDRPILIFFITDTDYLYIYVPDNWYAEPIFIYCYKVSEVSPFFTLVFPPFSS